TLYSPDFLTTEREFIGLIHARNGATNNAALAETTGQLIQSARERFRLWNLSDKQVDALARTGKASENVTLTAPFGGVVESLEAVQGAKVMPGDKLAGVTDLSVVWVWAQFYQDEISLLKTGLPVTVTTSSLPGRKFDGTISVVDPFVNDASHTARVRIDVKNPGLKLWPGMFVNAQLNIDEGERLAVPVNAVLPTGLRNIVFVDKGGGKLQPRFIQVGMQFGSFDEVESGLTNGERVVDSANFLIDAESQIQGALQSWSPEQ
ncbi:MAG: efflux RND transporter periplasmic adaptor subunit, partial [Limisphaerales bacterium]